jgi:malonate decarboxylase beta subunit
MSISYFEANARGRLKALLDPDSFVEFLKPAERVTSPHLPALDAIASFDDGIAVGRATIEGKPIFVAAQEGGFMGGAVGEVHGAKLTGLLERAAIDKPAAVVLLAESGGVRLHEANAGLIAISEIMRAVLDLRAAGVPVIVVDGGQYGCFGGMGITAGLCDAIIMNEEGRLGLSGPEVIETTCGVEEFDAQDRALVWRTVGGKHRYIMGDAITLVADDVDAVRTALVDCITSVKPDVGIEALERAQTELAARVTNYADCDDACDIWRARGVERPERLPGLDTAAFLEAVAVARRV